MRDDASGIAKVSGSTEELDTIKQGEGLFGQLDRIGSLEFKGHHSSTATLLPLGQRMLRMSRQTRVINPRYSGMGLQPFGQGLSIGIVGLHSDRQGLE